MKKITLTKKIKNNEYSDIDYSLIEEVYSIHGVSEEVFKRSLELIDISEFSKMIKTMQEIGELFSPSRFVKYLEYRNVNKYDSISEKFFKLKYGDNFREFLEKRVEDVNQSKSALIKKYGTVLGTKKFEKNRKTNAGNLSIERRKKIHGDEIGEKLFLETKQKMKNKNSQEYYIHLYGEEDGKRKHSERYEKRSNTIRKWVSEASPDEIKDRYDMTSKSSFIKRYGEIDGVNKFNEYVKNMKENGVRSGRYISDEDRSDWELYKLNVQRVTNSQKLEKLENIEKRSHRRYNEYAWHLDHKFSIKSGFEENIPPYIIGDISNLEMLPDYENCKKKSDCSISKIELFRNFTKL